MNAYKSDLILEPNSSKMQQHVKQQHTHAIQKHRRGCSHTQNTRWYCRTGQ